jgi:hypothetical protein
MNNQDRRSFIKKTGLGILGVAAMSRYGFSACAAPQAAAVKSGIGLQLYTIREDMAKDVPGSLKRVPILATNTLNWLVTAMENFMDMPPKNSKRW